LHFRCSNACTCIVLHAYAASVESYCCSYMVNSRLKAAKLYAYCHGSIWPYARTCICFGALLGTSTATLACAADSAADRLFGQPMRCAVQHSKCIVPQLLLCKNHHMLGLAKKVAVFSGQCDGFGRVNVCEVSLPCDGLMLGGVAALGCMYGWCVHCHLCWRRCC
jgi:hypothetical protein